MELLAGGKNVAKEISMKENFFLAQRLRKKVIKLLKRIPLDAVQDKLLRNLVSLEWNDDEKLCNRRRRAFLVSMLSLVAYALKKVANASWLLTKKNPYSGLNQCQKMAQNLAEGLGLKSPRYTTQALF